MSHQNGAGHVIIRAPAATATRKQPPPTAEEIVSFQAARIRELEAEAAKRTVASTTIGNTAIVLALRLKDFGHAQTDGSLLIPRDVAERIRGLQLTAEETPEGDVLVRVRDKEKPAPLAYEDRRE